MIRYDMEGGSDYTSRCRFPAPPHPDVKQQVEWTIISETTMLCINLLGGTILPRFLFQKRYVIGVAC